MPEIGNGSVSIRLEGGLGDHILGMRVLPFVRLRYPRHELIVYSDCAGNVTQLEVAAMSPFVSTVIPVFHRESPAVDGVGRFETLRAEDTAAILAHDQFIESYGPGLFASAAIALDVPVFDILSRRTELAVPARGAAQADELLSKWPNAILVAISMAKYGGEVLRRIMPLITYVLERLLRNTNVIVLNMFTSRYVFSHWPARERAHREALIASECELLDAICDVDERIIGCVNLPIATIVALLQRCRYFWGVDNGLKHVAWSLGVPLTYFHPLAPSSQFVMRWMPDVHRMLRCNCSSVELDLRLEEAEAALRM